MNYPLSARGRTYALYIALALLLILVVAIIFGGYKLVLSSPSSKSSVADNIKVAEPVQPVNEVPKKEEVKATDPAVFSQALAYITNGDSSGKWPVKTELPLAGAIFPYKRIIAYYGNLYSKQMGILGELPQAEMLARLQGEIDEWNKADTVTESIPALHYIAVTAQQNPGKGGKYRLRMPFHQIDSVINMAKKIDALVFVDVQVGLSSLQAEIPEFEEYLKLPNVHLGIDPEFSMKGGQAPGKVVGSFDAADINYTTEYLAKIVRENNLPPKVLVIHRFTQGMVTNFDAIKTRPEVQVVMDMDGWGHPELKLNTYQRYIYKEPVEFTGFKIFYKNDMKNNGRLLTPAELLALTPRPVYIQYQ
jgi:hypothetical protein